MKNKIALITGIKGFVGPFLQAELKSHSYQVFGIDLINSKEKNYFSVNILDKALLGQIIKKIQPDYIFHLAGFSSIEKSYKQPKLAREINVRGTDNLLSTVRESCPQAKILIVSSAQVYKAKNSPLKETDPLDPTSSPYAASRIEQEQLVEKYPELFIVISRSFNHIGSGQKEGAVVDFAEFIINSKDGGTLLVGNLKVKRDFSDVRDVVKAYRLLLEKSKRSQVYNICSGQAIGISWILGYLIKLPGKNLKIKIDPKKFRPVDVSILIGDNSKIRKEIGWEPKIRIKQTLEEMFNYYQKINNT